MRKVVLFIGVVVIALFGAKAMRAQTDVPTQISAYAQNSDDGYRKTTVFVHICAGSCASPPPGGGITVYVCDVGLGNCDL